MKHRMLRMAWSVAWGIVAVLLVTMWVRSYWRYDAYHLSPIGSHDDYCFASAAGRACMQHKVITRSDGSFYFSESEYDVDWRQYVDTGFWQIDGEGYLYRPVFTSAGFGIGSNRLGYGLLLPHWFLVLMAGSLAAAPWLPRNFGLRTLLVAITLTALGFGTIVWLNR